jgi:hypothetical protein
MKLNFCTANDNSGGGGGGGGTAGVGGRAGAGGKGAGIFNIGALSLNTCAISGNRCGAGGDGGAGGAGGGAVGGTGGGGGGIYNAGSLNSTSCTISLNLSGPGGNGGNGSVNLFPVSLAGPGGQGGNGGGVLTETESVAVALRNTLVVLNSVSTGGFGGTNIVSIIPATGPPVTASPGSIGMGPDLSGDFSSKGFNLIGMADGSTGFINGSNADQVGSVLTPIDPLLGPLQMNGGPTPTHALLPGSPAIDQGNSSRIHRDQRGHQRPQNYLSIPNAPGGDGSDIGAFELDRPH